jgi:hypothetical protein
VNKATKEAERTPETTLWTMPCACGSPTPLGPATPAWPLQASWRLSARLGRSAQSSNLQVVFLYGKHVMRSNIPEKMFFLDRFSKVEALESIPGRLLDCVWIRTTKKSWWSSVTREVTSAFDD